MVFCRWNGSHRLAYWFAAFFLGFSLLFDLYGKGQIQYNHVHPTWIHKETELLALFSVFIWNIYMLHARNRSLTKLVGWDLVFPCWSYLRVVVAIVRFYVKDTANFIEKIETIRPRKRWFLLSSFRYLFCIY